MISKKISVVIPTWNRAQLLLRCMKALSVQDFPAVEFEIIIVSDGPDVATQVAIENNPVRLTHTVHFFSLDCKRGPAAARNFGWKRASSDFIAFTDDDCIPDKKWLSSLWVAYQSMQLRVIAFTGRTIVPISDPPTDYERNISHLAKAEFITANCALTKSALQKVSGLDEQFTMAWREDSDLQFRLMQNNIRIEKISGAVITHPVRSAPWGISLRDERKGIYNALLYKKFPHLYRKKIQPQPPWLYYFTIAAFVIFISGIISKDETVAVSGLIVYVMLTMRFAFKRLSGTKRSLQHIAEMIFTSMTIPFLSVYYRLYGAWKFKVLLIP